MIQHMVLSMIAPIFIVLSTPITLALRALPAQKSKDHRSTREWLLAALHSRYSKLITHPLMVLGIFTFGLYALYFTPLFATLMASHTGHVFMEIHFFISGLLFSYVVIGADPGPRVVPYWSRLMIVLVGLSLHAFFAIAMRVNRFCKPNTAFESESFIGESAYWAYIDNISREIIVD